MNKAILYLKSFKGLDYSDHYLCLCDDEFCAKLKLSNKNLKNIDQDIEKLKTYLQENNITHLEIKFKGSLEVVRLIIDMLREENISFSVIDITPINQNRPRPTQRIRQK